MLDPTNQMELPVSPHVSLKIDGLIDLDRIVRSLEETGAKSVVLDRRTGNSYAGVSQYFFIEFVDGHDNDRPRRAFGFHANPSSESEHGWTRIALIADDRSRALLDDLTSRTGGELLDCRNGSIDRFVEPRGY